MCAQLVVNIGQASASGIKPDNQDCCSVHVPDEPVLSSKGIAAAIADGVSGSEAGREASQAIVKGFLADYFSTPESWSVKTSVQKILLALNHWLHRNSLRKYATHNAMVSTFSAVVFKSTTAYLFHVGDSRIYRLHDQHLEQLTQEHHVIIEQDKKYLSRALGLDLRLDVDFREIPLEIGDLFVFTTDGVYDFIHDHDLQQLLSRQTSLSEMAKAVIEQALANGSNDNVTCQLVRIQDLPSADETEFYKRLTELPFPPPLEAGNRLDHYRIVRQLHSAKRTEVYLGEDTQDGRMVVIKAPSVNYMDDAAYINQFLQEEWAGRRINNPHVLKVLSASTKRQFLYYVTEYVQGISLRQWMTDHLHPELQQVRNIIEQIAHGLRAFHRLEMVHQDLKPDNIIIDAHGTVKIIDFGSTRIAGIQEISTPLAQTPILGTINYSAPEYLCGHQGTSQSDLYSLGVIAYEILTGRYPYNKPLTERNLNLVRYQSAHELNPAVPRWMDKALEKAVQINPTHRYNLLSEFTHALSQPDPQLISEDFVPLLKRNPVRFWQVISALLFSIVLWLSYLILTD